MKIELPFPPKELWPNGGDQHHPRKINRLKKSCRTDAYYAAMAMLSRDKSFKPPDRLKIHLTIHPKPKGPVPDEDNCVSAFKWFQDGIADALKINDRNFKAPTVTFAERTKYGAFVVTI